MFTCPIADVPVASKRYSAESRFAKIAQAFSAHEPIAADDS
jgi:hypothetical protein